MNRTATRPEDRRLRGPSGTRVVRCLVMTATVASGALLGACNAQLVTWRTQVTDVHMTSPGVGWADDDRRLARTTDGGKSWTDASPEGLFVDLDEEGVRRGWLPITDSHVVLGASSRQDNPIGVGPPALYVTTDRGAHWTRSAGFPADLTPGAGVDFSFYDSNHGFVLTSDQALRLNRLFRTDDGGSSWTEVGQLLDQSPGPTPDIWLDVVFIDADHGWLTGKGSLGDAPLAETHDGGRTWKAEPQADPECWTQRCMLAGPRFTSSASGYMIWRQGGTPAGGAAGSTPAALLVTADGGRTWTKAALPEPALLGPATMVNARDGFVARYGEVYRTTTVQTAGGVRTLPGSERVLVPPASGYWLYVTHDGGTTWTPVQTARAYEPGTLDCLDGRRCWIDTGDGLVGTADGGATWVVLLRSR